MNQIYKIVWSAAQGAWVVCSELGSRKKQGGARAAMLVSAMVVGGGVALPAEAATCGDGSTATECTITALQDATQGNSYNPRLNDERVGQAIVDGAGQTLRLTGKASNVEQGTESHITTTPDQVSYQDENGNEMRDAERLTVGQKNNSVGAPNVPTRSVNTVATYNSDNIIGGTWGTMNVDVPNLSVGDNQYINARFVNASNEAKAEVNIEQDRDTLLMYAKRTTLAQAESGADIDWTSQNRINFGNANTYRASNADPNKPAEIGETTTIALTRQVPKYAGQVEFEGKIYNVTDAESLKVYNDALIARLKEPRLFPGEEQNGLQKAYDDAFNKAFSHESVRYTYKETIPADDVSELRGERWVMAASGTGSTVTVKDGAFLDVRSLPSTSVAGVRKGGAGGAMLAENGGTAIVEQGAKISGHFYQMVVRDKGSRGVNNGVISTGYYSGNGYDTAQKGNYNANGGYVEGLGVTVYDKGHFENNNIINVAGWTLDTTTGRVNYGVKAGNDSTVINSSTGVINVAVNNDIQGPTYGIIADGEGSTVSNDGEIYIGRTAQYEKGAATQETNPNLPTAGILVQSTNNTTPINTTVTHSGTITVGEKAQNATAIAVTQTAAGSEITLDKGSQIILKGAAQNANGSPPLQNIGLLAKDSGDAKIQTAGAITVNGINTVAVKLDGKAKVDATETSNITINGGQDPKSGTRNYAVYAEGYSADRQASGTIDGEINLNGVGAIGVHARNHAALTVEQGSSPKFNQGSDQIGFYIYGENASITTNEAEMTVGTERSNLYRIADGAKFVANGLTKITTSGKDSIAVLGTGSNTTINADTLTFNLTGEGSNALRIEGGATGNIDNNATVNVTGKGAVIGVVDGQGYDVNNKLDGGIKASTLNSSLDTTTNVEGVNAYIARNQGKLVYTGKTLTLSGNDSTAFSTDNGGIVEVNGSTVNVNANGTLVKSTEGSTTTPNTFTANNATLNATRLLDAQSGVTQFTANSSNLAGAFVKADNATSKVALNDSTWRVTADSAMTSLAVNNSTVRFSPLSSVADPKLARNFKTITTDSYTGDNANLIVNTSWYQDGTSFSDKLTINGDATGSTQVSTNGNIIGDVLAGETTKYSATVVEVKGTDSATFSGTAETTNAEQAQLAKVPGTNNYAWTLTAVPQPPQPDPEPQPEPQPVPPQPEQPSTPIYAPEVAAYVTMPKVNMEMGYTSLATLHERRGENQTLAWDECGTCGKDANAQSWVRILGRKLEEDGKKRFGYDSNMYGIQIGHDFAINRDENGGHQLSGAYFAYTRANTSFNDRLRAEDGIISQDKHTGKGKSEGFSLGVSHTRYALNGSYLDLVGQVSYLRNRYESRRGIKASQNGWGAILSAEVGRPYALSDYQPTEGVWMIEPQAQLSYQVLRLNDFNDGTRQVKPDTQHSLRGRVGVRLAYNAPTKELNTKTFYATANVLHDFVRSGKVNIGRSALKEKYASTWGEVGVGIQLPTSKQSYVYADARYEREFGGSAKRDGYRGTVGWKYTWK